MIGNDEFNNIREELTGKDPLIKRVKLADIKFEERSIETNTVLIKGHQVPVARSFFTRLAQVVGLNVALINQMQKNADRLIQQKLLEAVKSYAETRDGGKDFLLIGDPDQRKITNIVVADRYSRLTNDTLFQTTEMLMNEVPDLSIESIDRTGDGNFSINLVHTMDAGFEKLGPDEVFRFGLSLVNTNNRSEIKDFMYRLACSNGMISRTPVDDGPKLKGPSGGIGLAGPDAFRDIINQAHVWARNGFIPVSFEDRLTSAVDTPASLAELSNIFRMVESQIVEEDPDRKFKLIMAAKEQLFPNLAETERRLISKGFDPKALLEDEKRFIKTGRSVWDLVNDLTWLGSHKSVFDFNNPKSFKVAGGNLFTKKWDLQHARLSNV